MFSVLLGTEPKPFKLTLGIIQPPFAKLCYVSTGKNISAYRADS